MKETLEDLFQNLERLLGARDRSGPVAWTVKNRGTGTVAVYDRNDILVGSGTTLRKALLAARGALVGAARRTVVEAQ